jgi:hypothetical protein
MAQQQTQQNKDQDLKAQFQTESGTDKNSLTGIEFALIGLIAVGKDALDAG